MIFDEILSREGKALLQKTRLRIMEHGFERAGELQVIVEDLNKMFLDNGLNDTEILSVCFTITKSIIDKKKLIPKLEVMREIAL